MYDNMIRSVVASRSLTELVAVGGVTAHRLERDLGITSVDEVAEADVETLQDVWGVGPVRSARMKGSAQGIMNEAESRMDNIHEVAKQKYEIVQKAENDPSPEEMDEAWNERESGEKRVAIVAGQDELDKLSDDYANTVVDLAIDEAGVDLDDHTRVGFVNTDQDQNEMGGQTVSNWYDRTVATGALVRKQEFNTPWEKYSYFLWDEWGYDEQPDVERPKLKTDIPFDVARGKDVEGWMAPAERTRDMVRWADEVVIVVDGEYADSFRHKCEQLDVDCTTVFEINNGEVGAFDPTEHDLEGYTPPEEETFQGGDGPREGSVPDLADDRHLTMEPNDSLEQRPEVEDESAGDGVGSADAWTDYSAGQ